jgi:hypothetical protein
MTITKLLDAFKEGRETKITLKCDEARQKTKIKTI